MIPDPVVIVQTRGLVSFQVTELDAKGKTISTTDIGIGQEQDFIAVAGHEYRIKVMAPAAEPEPAVA